MHVTFVLIERIDKILSAHQRHYHARLCWRSTVRTLDSHGCTEGGISISEEMCCTALTQMEVKVCHTSAQRDARHQTVCIDE